VPPALAPAYDHLLKLGKERQSAILLDIGCCFGNDARKAVADRYPVQNVIASDLVAGSHYITFFHTPAQTFSEFWDLGHQLFKTTPETFPVPFLPGDAFDPSLLTPGPISYSPPTTPIPTLSSLTSLSPLQGHISAIHGSSFFHLFNEAKQFDLAKRLASLLSPEPGSVIFGSHAGREMKGERKTSLGVDAFLHSPQSWAEMWDGGIFEKGQVKVDAGLVKIERLVNNDSANQLLVWSVTRL